MAKKTNFKETYEALAKMSLKGGRTHDLARLLLALPDKRLRPLDQQGGPEVWSDGLAPEGHEYSDLQVAVRSFEEH